MPNAMNYFKPNQLIKVEKERENKANKRNTRQIQTTKDHKYGRLLKQESVWDRLSKTKKTNSQDLLGSLGSTVTNGNLASNLGSKLGGNLAGRVAAIKSRSILLAKKSTHRVVPTRSNSLTTAPPAKKWPLTPPQRKPNLRLTEKKSSQLLKKLKNACAIKDRVEKGRYQCEPKRSVKQILNVRSICNSDSSSGEFKYPIIQKKAISTTDSAQQVKVCTTKFLAPKPKSSSVDIGQKRLRKESIISFDSIDKYEEAPLMAVPTCSSLNNSAKITNNFQELLKRQHSSMEPEEIRLIKDVVKTDQRHRNLVKDDGVLFKDILQTQLSEIMKQEFVVKSALNKLDHRVGQSPRVLHSSKSFDYISSSMSTESVRSVANGQSVENVRAGATFPSLATLASAETITSAETIQADAHFKRGTAINMFADEIKSAYVQNSHALTDFSMSSKARVDVVFKNVPSLEKEILILKALGEKLEATLQRTMSRRIIPVTNSSTVAIKSLFMRPIYSYRWEMQELYAASLVVTKGIKQDRSVVNEYQIAHKTIVELKEDANRPFFIPMNDEPTDLKATCFSKMKSDPDVLMRHLKQKNSYVPFSILEQDPIFFNNLILKNSSYIKSPRAPARDDDECEKQQPSSPVLPSQVIISSECGDSFMIHNRALNEQLGEKKSYKKLDIVHHDDNQAKAMPTVPLLQNSPNDQHSLVIEESVENLVENKSDIFLDNISSDESLVDPLKKSKPIAQSSPKVTLKQRKVNTGAASSAVGNKKKGLMPVKEHNGGNRRERERSVIRSEKNKNRSHRLITPLPYHKNPEPPKSDIWKTILIGTVQISIFLILIIAITYPDATC